MARLLSIFTLVAAGIPLPGSDAALAEPSPSAPSLEAQADTLEGVQRGRALILHHYRGAGRSASARGNQRGGTQDRFCSGGEGSVCHGGDPDRGECNANVPCHPNEEWLVEGLAEAARANPTSGFLMGQAIYAMTKFGQVSDAEELVQVCRAEEWWCEALRGYVLYTYAPLDRVEVRFRSAFERAPEAVRCRWGDAHWLLGEWDQRVGGLENLPSGREATEGWDCATRLAASDTLFWWADPLFSREGNDRWTVHMARAVAGHLHQDLQRTLRGSEPTREQKDRDWAMRIRRGQWDSYERLPGRNTPRFWTSEEAARIHFVPDVSPGDLSEPTWRFRGDLRDEGYSPEYGPLFHISSQVARFREGDSLLLVAAGGLETTRLRRAVGAISNLVLSDAPGSFPLRIERETRQSTPVLTGRAPHLPYVVSFEVETDIGMGVSRELVSPLSTTGAEVSDLLLFGADGQEEPVDLLGASATMLGSTRFEEGDLLGVFWEVYGAPVGGLLSFEITLERESGGVVDRLTGLFPGGEEGERGRVIWTEPASGPVHPRGLTLNLSSLRDGDYFVVLSVRWPGQPPLQRRRALRVG
jgi:hypothetical protein